MCLAGSIGAAEARICIQGAAAGGTLYASFRRPSKPGILPKSWVLPENALTRWQALSRLCPVLMHLHAPTSLRKCD